MGVLKDVLSISGQSGLFRFISQGRQGVIVESIESKKRMNASASFKISALEDIAIFTEDKELPLEEVMKRIYQKEQAKSCINHKSPTDELVTYFKEIVPDYDQDRVYVSDMKKVCKWYNILIENNMLSFEESEEEKEENEESKENEEKEENEVKEEKEEKEEKE